MVSEEYLYYLFYIYIIFIFILYLYLFILSYLLILREREYTCTGKAAEERKSQAGFVLSARSPAQCAAQAHEP